MLGGVFSGILFQFHKGTIKTLSQTITDCKSLGNFNSIKVRLKQFSHSQR